MSGDILFDRGMWAVQGQLFDETMQRAIPCSGEDTVAADLFSYAQRVSVLNLERYEIRDTRTRLARYLDQAADRWLTELRNDPSMPRIEVTVQRLRTLIAQYLTNIAADPAIHSG